MRLAFRPWMQPRSSGSVNASLYKKHSCLQPGRTTIARFRGSHKTMTRVRHGFVVSRRSGFPLTLKKYSSFDRPWLQRAHPHLLPCTCLGHVFCRARVSALPTAGRFSWAFASSRSRALSSEEDTGKSITGGHRTHLPAAGGRIVDVLFEHPLLIDGPLAIRDQNTFFVLLENFTT